MGSAHRAFKVGAAAAPRGGRSPHASPHPAPQIGAFPSSTGAAVNLSLAGPSGLQANPLYYKGTGETQRFEQVAGRAHRGDWGRSRVPRARRQPFACAQTL
jgi:hypothetical protein